jgi:hypothetical protein
MMWLIVIFVLSAIGIAFGGGAILIRALEGDEHDRY